VEVVAKRLGQGNGDLAALLKGQGAGRLTDAAAAAAAEAASTAIVPVGSASAARGYALSQREWDLLRARFDNSGDQSVRYASVVAFFEGTASNDADALPTVSVSQDQLADMAEVVLKVRQHRLGCYCRSCLCPCSRLLSVSAAA
jgi:hypothetical protein